VQDFPPAGNPAGGNVPARLADLVSYVRTMRCWRVLGVAAAGRLRFALAGLALLAGLAHVLVALPSASAATGHRFLGSISEAPIGTPLQEPGPVAMDRADGDLFVGDLGARTVDVFSDSGAFLGQLGEEIEPAAIAVDEADGDVYVATGDERAVLVFKPNGSGGYQLLSEWTGAEMPGKEFGEPVGVAVDDSASSSAGDVYVVAPEGPNGEEGVVDVLEPHGPGSEEASEGELVRTLQGAKLQEPNGVAVDPRNGRVYVADSSQGRVYEYGASGSFEGKLKGTGSPQGSFEGEEGETGNVTALAVDPTSGDLLVLEAERRVVVEFNASGEWQGWITGTPTGPFAEPSGLAGGTAGEVFVADAGLHVVDRFGPPVVVPDVKTAAASKLTRTGASLNGIVDGGGKAATYRFEWGTSEALGSSTPAQASGGVEEKASASLSNLHAGTTYFFRVSAENENGGNVGAVREFTTPPAVEGVGTGAVEGLQPTEATLTGTLTPGGVEAHYYFEWGTTSSYGRYSPALPPGVDAGAGETPVTAQAPLSGLAPNTTYHYRLVAVNEFGVTAGADAKFTTPGPPRIAGEPPSGIGHETATIKARIDPDERETKYRFEYGESAAYEHEVPIGGASIPAGETQVSVAVALTGLNLGVTYHYRVVATNAAGTTAQPDQRFTTIPPALIDEEAVTHVSATAATLQTEINPLGHETTYYFQYGTANCALEASSCSDSPEAPGAGIGAGEADQARSLSLQELTPDTTYSYRVVAINSLGTENGPLRTFTTGSSTSSFTLPDGRAWELVSQDKSGTPIEALTREGGLILAAEDGDSLTYVADGSIGEEVQGNRAPEMQQVIATRTSEGWHSQDVSTPQSRAQGVAPGAAPEYQFFTPDLSSALVEPVGVEPPLTPEVTQTTMYIRDNETSSYLPLVYQGDVAPGTSFGGQVHFVGATPGLEDVVIQSRVALTGPASGPGLYEWSDGKLHYVTVLPDGTLPHETALGFAHVAANAISSDGTRVIWTNSTENPAHLYMTDTDTGQTLQLDAAQGASEPTSGSARFQTATSDGSRVFFTDTQKLTEGSSAEPTFGKADLYECEIVEREGKLACQLKDLTADPNAGEYAAVQGFLLGASADGSSVFLVAQGVLADNENAGGERATGGSDNLYELHEAGGAWTSTFIAGLSSEDGPEWEGNRQANPAYVTARVSPNGRYLAFMSAASLTGYDNVDANSGKRDEEVFLYDAGSGSITCVSCDPSGARPAGVLDTEEAGEGLGLVVDRRKVWIGHYLAGNIPGWTAQSLTTALFQSRYLSDEGRLFFNSPDDLVPAASNGKNDVYEYEPAGVGGCESASAGCVSLISSGSSPQESAFLEATPSGDDVFFLTSAQLSPQETDTGFHIYDARVCTQASPCLNAQTTTAGSCGTANACRPAPPGQVSTIGPAGTAALSGSTNVVSAVTPKQEKRGVKVSSKRPTREQLLAAALKACKKVHGKHKRKACEVRARERFGVRAKAKGKRSSARARTKTGRAGRSAARVTR
jgi:phosphodiesterase/alkaline phosphatase D-like protein